MKFRRILVCCSLNPQARGMLSNSIQFARAFGEELHFCHVGEDDPEIRRRLFLFLEDMGIKDVKPVLIRGGSPDKVVCGFAREIGADLIMAGALAHESSLVGIFGSVARRIVRRADCSVLLLTGVPQPAFRSMIANIRYEESSRCLMHCAITLAEHYRARLHIAHEYDYRLRFLHSEAAGNERAVRNYEHECEAVEESRLRDFLRDFDWQKIHPVPVCLKGTDGSELTRYARKFGADLILVPVKAISFWDRFFHAQAEVLLQDMPCSILFYRVSAHG